MKKIGNDNFGRNTATEKLVSVIEQKKVKQTTKHTAN